MSKTMINIKTDVSLKKDAQKVADEMGLPLSVVINNYLRSFVRERRVIFDSPLAPNKATAKVLDQILDDIKNGRNMVGPFDNVEDFMASLES